MNNQTKVLMLHCLPLVRLDEFFCFILHSYYYCTGKLSVDSLVKSDDPCLGVQEGFWIQSNSVMVLLILSQLRFNYVPVNSQQDTWCKERQPLRFSLFPFFFTLVLNPLGLLTYLFVFLHLCSSLSVPPPVVFPPPVLLPCAAAYRCSVASLPLPWLYGLPFLP